MTPCPHPVVPSPVYHSLWTFEAPGSVKSVKLFDLVQRPNQKRSRHNGHTRTIRRIDTPAYANSIPPMLSELDLLLDVTRRLEDAGLDYMLTGSMALNHYAQPRMTRDIDFVIALLLKDLDSLPLIFGEEFYFSPEAAREAVLHQSSFNLIHNESLIKIDFIIRKREDYRLVEFERRRRIEVQGHPLWIVSKEDLILSKLDWAKDSLSQRQLADVENLLATGADLNYLQSWSRKLNLTDMLIRVSP